MGLQVGFWDTVRSDVLVQTSGREYYGETEWQYRSNGKTLLSLPLSGVGKVTDGVLLTSNGTTPAIEERRRREVLNIMKA